MTLDEELEFYSKNLHALSEASESVAPYDDPGAVRLGRRIRGVYLATLAEFVKLVHKAFGRDRILLGSVRRFPIEHRFMILRARAEEARSELDRSRTKRGRRKLKRLVLELEMLAREAAGTLKKRAQEVGAWSTEYAEKYGLVPPWVEED